ncbi:MAG: manganese efflux pump MntP family protein, partial [Firmicutes bacterium]|nr:manganese efflux pump MntP family protein [Bacillota bacterium]
IPGGPSVMLPGAVGLLSLGASVSMDALTVGFTLGIYHFEPLLTAAVVGFVAGLMTALGLGLGRLIRAWVGRRAQLVGGLILFGVGINLLR